MKKIKISVAGNELIADLKDTPTATKIYESLPVEGRANVWGEEIYFDISLDLELEPEARAEIEVGELAYWPTGKAFCIFFGRTPVSIDEKTTGFSPVIYWKLMVMLISLKKVKDGGRL